MEILAQQRMISLQDAEKLEMKNKEKKENNKKKKNKKIDEEADFQHFLHYLLNFNLSQ